MQWLCNCCRLYLQSRMTMPCIEPCEKTSLEKNAGILLIKSKQLLCILYLITGFNRLRVLSLGLLLLLFEQVIKITKLATLQLNIS